MKGVLGKEGGKKPKKKNRLLTTNTTFSCFVGPRIEAIEKLGEFVAGDDFKAVEACVVAEMLPTSLKRCDDKPKVAEAAKKVGQAMMNKLSVEAFPFALKVLFAEMVEESKWKAKVGAMEFLETYMAWVESADRDLLSACLPELVPALTPMMHNTNIEVAELAEKASLLTMKGITNRDPGPFSGAPLNAFKIRAETEETIQKLGGVVFVQTVDGSALSVVVPLMMAGFRQSKALVKRMCARIMSNMSKVVDGPLEAAPFVGELIPALFDAIVTIAGPEARSVAEKTHAALVVIDEKAKVAAVDKAVQTQSVIEDALAKKLGGKADATASAVAYISMIAASRCPPPDPPAPTGVAAAEDGGSPHPTYIAGQICGIAPSELDLDNTVFTQGALCGWLFVATVASFTFVVLIFLFPFKYHGEGVDVSQCPRVHEYQLRKTPQDNGSFIRLYIIMRTKSLCAL